MKKTNFKRFLLLFGILVCVFSLTACSDTISADKAKETTKEKEVAGYTDSFKLWAEDMLRFLDTASDEQIKQYAETSETLDEVNGKMYTVNPDGMGVKTVEFYNSWVKNRQDLGRLKTVDEIKVTVTDDTDTLCTISVKASYEDRNCTFELVLDEDMNLTSGAVNPTYTVGEKMSKAGMNTLIGMGTVFIVLIFISFIISLLKHVNKIDGAKKQNESEKRTANQGIDNAIAQIVTKEENEMDDLELVAVITAAIAAAKGTSSDGLIVRSIRRVQADSRRN